MKGNVRVNKASVYFLILNLLFWVMVNSCFTKEKEQNQEKIKTGGDKMDWVLTSSAFKDGERIPTKYTCDGEDIAPPLQWNMIPEGTKSYVLIMDDPDAPMGTWDHWIVWNIDPSTSLIEENKASFAAKLKKLYNVNFTSGEYDEEENVIETYEKFKI